MLTREDKFRLYIPFYHKWFGPKACWLSYVNGEFFMNKRNIVCVFSPSEIISITQCKKGYFCGVNEGLKFAIVGARLELEGTEIKGEYQYIRQSEFLKEHKVEDYKRQNLCLVAYRKETSYYVENPCIDDYEYRYEICSDEELTLCEKVGMQKLGYGYNRTICSIRFLNDKKHTYKTKLDLPIVAIPHWPGSNREFGGGTTLPIENFNWSTATGIGIVGAGNNELRCIDIDGCQSEDFLISFLKSLGLPPNYRWVIKTGSNEGYHIWIWCKDLPENLLLCGESKRIFEDSHVIYFLSNPQYRNTFRSIEVRWNAFCMLPPSIGPSGLEYSFLNGIPKEGMYNVEGKDMFEVISSIASNTTVDFASLVDHRAYGWSESESVESIFMCFDTETTGLPRDYNASFEDTDNWPRIVQISYVIFEITNGKIYERDKKDFILCPKDFEIPRESLGFTR